MYKFRGYDVFVSDRKDKKYYAIVNKKRVYFGNRDYQHYHDKLGHYKELNHEDKPRRSNYRKRAAGITNSRGQKTYAIPGTANWFAYHVLW